MHKDCWLELCIRHGLDIGLHIERRKGATGFTKGIDIENGVLFVDCDMATPADMLHECGHIAITPQQYRHLLQTNVTAGLRRMLDAIEQSGAHPDSPLYVAAIQASDTEATAWAWAAGKHLGIPEHLIIKDEDYDNGGENIRLMLRANAYLGINGLARAGFCPSNRYTAKASGQKMYPSLIKWVQPNNLSPEANYA